MITFVTADPGDDVSSTVLGAALEPGDVLVTSNYRPVRVDASEPNSDGLTATVRTAKGYGTVALTSVYFSPAKLPLSGLTTVRTV